jgi:hypothetical protein
MTEISVVAHKPPGLPLIDGAGAVGDPASQPFLHSIPSYPRF